MITIYIFLIITLIFIVFQLKKSNNLLLILLKLKENQFSYKQEEKMKKGRFPHLYYQIDLKDDIDNYNYSLEKYFKEDKKKDDTTYAIGIIRKIKDEFINNQKYKNFLKENESWIKNVVKYYQQFTEETKETKEITGYELYFITREVWWKIYTNIEENIELNNGKIELELKTVKDFWFNDYLIFFPNKK